jgi:hypothetical protein
MDDKALMELTAHIREHVSYPISKKDFMAACENLGHVPAETREWVGKALPDRTFRSAEEIFHTLDLPHSH